MKHTKYVMSGGLAFSEEKDMEKLRKLSTEGWHVSGFKFMGYTLKKGDSADYIYSVDYRSLKEKEVEEYLGFFSSSGWTHISSEGSIHLFRALPDTKPIESDRETTAEKHDNSSNSMKWLVASLILITVFSWLGTLISTGSLQKVLTIISYLLLVFTIPASMTFIATFSNKWTAVGKKKLVKLVKYLSVIFLLIAVLIIFLVADRSTDAVLTLASMLLGGIAIPTAIWIIMSLYLRLQGKN